jgi:hypothetical protein
MHPLENIKVALPDDQVAAMSMIRTHSTDISRQRLERLEEMVTIAGSLMPMSDVISASASPHVVEASSETSNSAFATALIIAIAWPGVSFALTTFTAGT